MQVIRDSAPPHLYSGRNAHGASTTWSIACHHGKGKIAWWLLFWQLNAQPGNDRHHFCSQFIGHPWTQGGLGSAILPCTHENRVGDNCIIWQKAPMSTTPSYPYSKSEWDI